MEEYHKEYYKKNRGKILKKHRDWREKNREHIRQYSREYFQKNKEKLILYRKEYQQKWRKENKTYQKEWYAKNKEDCLKRTLMRYRKLKEKFIQLLGGKCQKCGYSKCIAALEFHHKDPDEKESNGDPQKKDFEQKILEGKIQLLCNRCHRELHHEVE